MTTCPDLYEAICIKDTPAGRISLHVPVIKLYGLLFNANTGLLEPWVKSTEPMVGTRRKGFEAVAERTAEKVRLRLRVPK